MEELSILNQIQAAAVATSTTEWLATIFSIIYVILAARESIWCWPFGLIGVTLSFLVYIDPGVRLYSDATLQVYYMAMSVYGWITWRKRGEELANGKEDISQWSMKEHGLALAIGTVLAILLGYFWIWMDAGAARPYIDAFTTSFSIIATYMVARKILENWLYWIVIDVVCIFLYWERELYLFSILFLIYTVIAVFGFFKWRGNLIKD